MHVRADYPRAEADSSARLGKTLDELYGIYYEELEGVTPPPELLKTFREVMEEAGYASS